MEGGRPRTVPAQLERRVETTDDMLALGRQLGQAVRPLPAGGLVIDLRGDLGVGKTVLVRGIARGLGLAEATAVVSPTFTIARSYAIRGAGGEVALHHVDAYRLSSEVELDAAGFEEMCGDGCLTCVEWGERVPAALPEDRLQIALTMVAAEAPDFEPGAVPQCARTVRVTATGPRAERVLARLRAHLTTTDGGAA